MTSEINKLWLEYRELDKKYKNLKNKELYILKKSNEYEELKEKIKNCYELAISYKRKRREIVKLHMTPEILELKKLANIKFDEFSKAKEEKYNNLKDGVEK